MKTEEQRRDVVRSGYFEDSQFSIAAGSKAFTILSDQIYTHKIRAVIRELSCNAYDSHIEAGNPDPFKVHMPTRLEPWFSVKDEGTGLSHDDCMHLYTTYFASTKTNTNDQIGCLGLGSKSPFAYTDSFVVTSVYDGEKRVYSAHKSEDNTPHFSLLTCNPTDEPNGVEVRVDVKPLDRDEFYKEAANVFQYFETLPKINVPEITDRIEGERQSIVLEGDSFILHDGGDSVAVMGNVAYPIPRYGTDVAFSNNSLVLKFGLGEISFLPGRESLELNTKTAKALKDKLEEARNEITQIINDRISESKTLYEARINYLQLSKGPITRLCKTSNLKWRGQDISGAWIKLPEDFICTKYYGVRQRGCTICRTENVDKVYLTEKGLQAYIQQKYADKRIRHAVRSHSMDTVYVINDVDAKVFSATLGHPKFPFGSVDDLEDPPKRQYVKTVKVLMWSGSSWQDQYAWSNETVEVDLDEKQYYVKVDRFAPSGDFFHGASVFRDIINVCKQHFGIPSIYGVRKSLHKQKKFKNSAWIPIEQYLIDELKKLSKKFPYPTTETFRSQDTCHRRLRQLIPKLEDDHPVRQWCLDVDDYNQQKQKIFDLIGVFEKFCIPFNRDTTLKNRLEEIYKTWPMLGLINPYDELKGQKLELVTQYLGVKA